MRVTQQHKPLSPVGDHLEGTAGSHRPGPRGGARSAWSTDVCLGGQSSLGCSDTSGRRSAWSRCLPRQSRAQGSETQVSLCASAAPPSRGARPGLSHEGRSFVNTREAETEIKAPLILGNSPGSKNNTRLVRPPRDRSRFARAGLGGISGPASRTMNGVCRAETFLSVRGGRGGARHSGVHSLPSPDCDSGFRLSRGEM